MLAVTMQNPGPDRIEGTPDDALAKLNRSPSATSVDMNPGSGCGDNNDSVQNFRSTHPSGGFFLMGDGSVQWVSDTVDATVYQQRGSLEDRRG